MYNNFNNVDNRYGSDIDADYGVIDPETGIWDARGSIQFPYSLSYVCEVG